MEVCWKIIVRSGKWDVSRDSILAYTISSVDTTNAPLASKNRGISNIEVGTNLKVDLKQRR
jgi:hypothetical protein